MPTPARKMSAGAKTRERILTAALRLYNEHGLYSQHGAQVTARKIAEAAGLSDSNLRYHFRTREDIVVALYEQLVERFDVLIGALAAQTPALGMMEAALRVIYATMAEYRFLMLDLPGIMRRIPRISAHYRELQAIRRQQLTALWGNASAAGFLRQDIPPAHIEGFMERMQILSDAWLANAENFFPGDLQEAINHYARLNAATIYPYLTEKGKVDWDKMNN
ncbi:MAG: TetR/AcrR family transcriptional regulator [Bacteroidota bacterium]